MSARWVAFLVTCALCSEVDQWHALMELYTATNGVQWLNDTGWGGKSSVCTWYGVQCDATGNVTQLNLAYNNLHGRLTAGLVNLTQMRIL